MKKLLGLISLTGFALATAASTASAQVMTQSQSFSQSGNASATVTGGTSTSASATATTSQSGSQQQTTWGGYTGGYVAPVAPVWTTPTYAPNWINSGYVAPAPVAYVAPTYTYNTGSTWYTYYPEGRVFLGWPMRGGTCHVRYTEANQSWYKYATAAGCDDGGVVIGGLTPGVKYKFQVSQDRANWTKPVVIKAR